MHSGRGPVGHPTPEPLLRPQLQTWARPVGGLLGAIHGGEVYRVHLNQTCPVSLREEKIRAQRGAHGRTQGGTTVCTPRERPQRSQRCPRLEPGRVAAGRDSKRVLCRARAVRVHTRGLLSRTPAPACDSPTQPPLGKRVLEIHPPPPRSAITGSPEPAPQPGYGPRSPAPVAAALARVTGDKRSTPSSTPAPGTQELGGNRPRGH